jgi:hypothetical protein
MPIRQKFSVGDSIYLPTDIQPRTIIKVVGNYLKLEGLGARHVDFVEKADYRRYGNKITILTSRDLQEFFSNVPKGLASKSKLIVTTEDKGGVSELTDFSNLIGGLSGVKKWSNEFIGSDDLDDEIFCTDKFGFRNYIVLDLLATKNESTLDITLEIIPDHVHLIPKLNKVESIIRKELAKGNSTTRLLKKGADLKRILIEYPDEKLSFSSMEIEALIVVESLIRRCLFNWPRKPYGNKLSLEPQIWLSKPEKYDNIVFHITIVLNLINSNGENQKLESDSSK